MKGMGNFWIEDGETALFIGDSITDCGRRDANAPLGDGYVCMVAELATAQFPDRKIRYLNKGIGGNTILDLRERWVEDVLEHRPDRLAIKIGINDLHQHLAGGERAVSPARFAQVYEELLEHTGRELGCPLLLITPFYISVDGAENPNGAQVLGRAQVDLQGVVDVAASVHSELPALNALLGEPRALDGTADVDILISGAPTDPVAEVTALVREAQLTLPGAQVPVVHYAFGDVTAQALVTRDAIQVLQAEVCFRGLERCHDPDDPDRIVASATIRPDLSLEDGEVIAEGVSLAHILRKMGAAPNPWTDFTGDAELSLEGTLNPLELDGPFEMVIADWRTTGGPVDQPQSTETLVIPRASARGNIALRKDHLFADAPLVTGPSSRGRATVRVGFGPKGPLDLRANLTHADLSDFAPLGGSELGGIGTMSGRLWGPFNELQFAGQGDIEDFTVIGIDWADQLTARLASPDMKRIEVLDATARVGDTPYTGSYILGFQDPMWMDMDIAIPDGHVRDLVHLFLDLDGIDGGVSGTLDLSGPLFDLDGEAHLELTDPELFGEQFETGAGHGYMDGGLFTLDDLHLLRRDGAEGITLRGGVDREWALDMELVADGFALDHLDTLADVDLPVTGSARMTAHLGNTLFDPAPSGTLAVTSARFDGARIPDSTVEFETRYGVLRYTGALFGGSVVAAGSLGLWNEQPYTLSAAMQRFSASWLYPEGADGSPVDAVFTGSLTLDGHFGDDPSPVDLGVDVIEADIRWRDHHLTETGPWHYSQKGDASSMRCRSVHSYSISCRSRTKCRSSLASPPARATPCASCSTTCPRRSPSACSMTISPGASPRSTCASASAACSVTIRVCRMRPWCWPSTITSPACNSIWSTSCRSCSATRRCVRRSSTASVRRCAWPSSSHGRCRRSCATS